MAGYETRTALDLCKRKYALILHGQIVTDFVKISETQSLSIIVWPIHVLSSGISILDSCELGRGEPPAGFGLAAYFLAERIRRHT